MRIQRVVLEHHGDVALFRLHVVDDAVADRNRPGGDPLQPRQHPQQGGLAAARRTDQHHESAVLDGNRDAVQDLEAAVVALKARAVRSAPPASTTIGVEVDATVVCCAAAICASSCCSFAARSSIATECDMYATMPSTIDMLAPVVSTLAACAWEIEVPRVSPGTGRARRVSVGNALIATTNGTPFDSK